MEKRGRGYVGNEMSVNAKLAYSVEEMPLSKWTKSAIVEVVENENDDLTAKAKSLPLWILKTLLVKSSWHHTGMFYNSTDFYTFDIEALKNLTKEEIEEMKLKRSQELESTKDERQAKQKAKREAKELKERYESVLCLTKYKKVSTLISKIEAGEYSLEDLEKQLKEKKEAEENSYYSQIESNLKGVEKALEKAKIAGDLDKVAKCERNIESLKKVLSERK